MKLSLKIIKSALKIKWLWTICINQDNGEIASKIGLIGYEWGIIIQKSYVFYILKCGAVI